MKFLVLLLVVFTASGIYGVDRNNFKTCDQAGFCKRLRSFKPEKSQYSLNLDSVMVHGNVLSAEVNTIDSSTEKKTVLVRCDYLIYLSVVIIYHPWADAKLITILAKYFGISFNITHVTQSWVLNCWTEIKPNPQDA